MMSAGGKPSSSTSSKSRPGLSPKDLAIQEYKRRLKDNVRSLNDNFINLVNAGKINTEETAHSGRMANGKMAEFMVTKVEMDVRGALIVKACDELLKLTNDLKEFLILHDFNFLTEAIGKAESDCNERLTAQLKKHTELRTDISKIVYDIDKEVHEHFSLRP